MASAQLTPFSVRDACLRLLADVESDPPWLIELEELADALASPGPLSEKIDSEGRPLKPRPTLTLIRGGLDG